MATTLRGNQLPAALKGTCCKEQFRLSIRGYFFVTKIRFTLFATKINKNLELSFVFVQMNAAHCIGGQNKKYDNEYYSAVSFLWDAFL